MTQPPYPNRRTFLGSLIAAPLLTAACRKDYGRFFDIEWDEEVELHNGRIIIVHIKRTFERVTSSMRRSRWNGMERAIEIDFDAGGEIGRYKRKFDGYDINYIEQSYGNWYISLAGLSNVLGRNGVHRIVKQEVPIWIIFSNRYERPAQNWKEVPKFPRINIMPITPNPEAISKFNKTTLFNSVKMAHWEKFRRWGGDDGKTKDVGVPRPDPE